MAIRDNLLVVVDVHDVIGCQVLHVHSGTDPLCPEDDGLNGVYETRNGQIRLGILTQLRTTFLLN